MPYSGIEAVCYVGLTNSKTSAVQITAEGNGCNVAGLNESHPSREVPGFSDVVNRESMERSDHSLSFEVDANDNTHPLLAGTSGKKVYYWYYPRGEKTGLTEEKSNGFLTVNVNFPANDAIRFVCTVEADAAVERSTVA